MLERKASIPSFHRGRSANSIRALLVSAVANVEARTSTLNLAQELARVNKAKVDVGQSPPIDLVSAQAEVAADEEQLIIVQTAVRQAEDRLRLLIFEPTDQDYGSRDYAARDPEGHVWSFGTYRPTVAG